jgi:hypothetical protein
MGSGPSFLGILHCDCFHRLCGLYRGDGVLTASVIAWSFFHIVWLYRFFLFEVTLATV